ncbi:DUF4956 domain-containing protein [Patescibacteria group bacterium]
MGGLSNLLSQAPAQPTLGLLVFDILLTAICSMILARFYVKFGQSLSNRERLAKNFLLISVTTALIITVVKSSLALSLGLVGALSIVRFRSAIKEPEELAYLFLSISLGLGFGANQHAITLIAFFLILGLVYFQAKLKGVTTRENLFLTVKMPSGKKNLDDVVNKLKQHCQKIDLKRVDQNKDVLEIALEVELKKIDQVDKILKEVKSLSKTAEVSLIDQTGIVV